MAQSIDMPTDEFKKIAREIAESLNTNYSYNEAAIVYEQYLDSPSEAISSLLTGGNYEEALRLVR